MRQPDVGKFAELVEILDSYLFMGTIFAQIFYSKNTYYLGYLRDFYQDELSVFLWSVENYALETKR